MYCSHCGKKVNDSMFYCPFCGHPIIVPEQDDEESLRSGEPRETSGESPASNAALDFTGDSATASRESPDAAEDGVAPLPPPDGEATPAENFNSSDTPEASVWSRRRDEPIFSPLERPGNASESVAEPQTTGLGTEAGPELSRPASDTSDAEAELMRWGRDRWDVPAAQAQSDSAEGFAPLEVPEEPPQADWRAEIERKKESAAPKRKPPKPRAMDDPQAQLSGHAPKLSEADKPRSGQRPRQRANTLIPEKALQPEDMFMDGGGTEDDLLQEEFAFEDEAESTFFMRHLRGMVGLALFVILALLIVIFAFSKPGQYILAKANLTSNPNAYMQLGNEMMMDGQFEDAGRYFEKALSYNAEYTAASAAANAYMQAKNLEKAVEMLKRCIELNPTNSTAYSYLLQIYPNAADRPWEITQLIRQGYEQTGDSRFNVSG